VNYIRFALRQILKHPGFSAIAIIALALGIGANTAIFSIINTLFLQPLPYAHPEEIVQITSTEAARNFDHIQFSYPRLRVVRDGQQVFSELAVTTGSAVTLTGEGDPEQLQIMMASANYLPLLGVQPLHGRGFLPEEDRPGGRDVVILSHRYWQKRYAGNPAVIGQSITLDGKPHTIISVLPKSLSQFPFNQIDLWMPRPYDASFLTPAQIENGGFFFNVFGRLKPGVTLAQAREAVGVLAAGYAREHPSNADAKSKTEVEPVLFGLTGNQRGTFGMLFAAVGCVLLIACANVANLLLTRFSARRKEIAIRFALGAKRSHVVLQFLTESLLLAVCGGILGLAFAYASIQLVMRLGQNIIPRVEEISLDPTVLMFTLLASIATGVIMGLAPALQCARADVNEALKDASRGSTGDGRHNRFRSGLLIAEVAGSVVLLIAASLLISSFVRLQNVSPGFKAAGVFTGQVVIPASQYPARSDGLVNLYSRLYQRLQAIPGATSVALSDNPPLSGNVGASPYAALGRPVPPLSEQPMAIRNLISPNRFALLGIPIKSGRDFNESDTPMSTPVIIINETMAKKLFPGENPLGQKLITGSMQLTAEVVGVVADTLTANLTQPPQPEMYYSLLQRPENFTFILVRTDGDPSAMANSVRAALREVDSGLPLTNPGTMHQFVEQSTVDRRLTMIMLAVFAVIALILACIGVYSVMAYAVSQRTGEIGVRMALGAGPKDIVRMILGDGMKLVLIGVGLGLAGALALTRLMTALLFEVRATDPVVYAGVIALILLVAFLANFIPALRATRIDPMVALRTD
jgi:predicted permease